MGNILVLVPRLTPADVVDIVLVAVPLYIVMLTLKRARMTPLITWLGLFTAVYFAARSFDLQLTTYVFHATFAVMLIGLIVIFQEEIRWALERLVAWQTIWPNRARSRHASASTLMEGLAETLTELARDRIGALIVFRGKDHPDRFLRGGAPLQGFISDPLLKSIFDPHSFGHDGAVVVDGDRVERFGCHLPLSTNDAEVGKRGTRHAAALGFSERTDALCVVVSEERGTITVARHGKLREVADQADLARVLLDFDREIGPDPARRPFWADAIQRNLGLKAAALLAAALMWFVVVHESTLEYRTFTPPIQVVGLRFGQTATAVEPPTIRVVVSAPRRAFYGVGDEDLRVDLKLFDRLAGTYELFVTAGDVVMPEGMELVNVFPRQVQVTIGAPGLPDGPPAR